MIQEKIKNSLFLKTVCTLILPILLFCIAFSILAMSYEYEYPEIGENPNFYDSNSFKDTYLSQILNTSQKSKIFQENNKGTYANINTFEAEDGTIYYYETRSQSYDSNFIYLIIDYSTNEAFTNIKQTVETDTILEIKQKIANKKHHWILDENGISTDIEKLKEDNIKYDNLYELTKENLGEKKLYTYSEENNKNNINKEVYNIVAKWNKKSFKLLIGTMVITTIIGIYLCVSLGHKYGEEKIYLNKIDSIPLEIIIVIVSILILIPAFCIGVSANIVEENWNIGVKLFLVSLYIFTEISLISSGILIKKLKARQLFKNSLTYRLIKWVKKEIKKTMKFIKESIESDKKLIIYYIGFIVISIILATMASTGVSIIILIAFGFGYLKN